MSRIEDYDYELPKHLIAQAPLPQRADARLLVVDRSTGTLAHHHIRDLPELLRPGDCLVLNDTKVVPARLVGYRTRTGGRWEGLFLELDAEHGLWRILCKSRGRMSEGEAIRLVRRDGTEDTLLQLVARLPGGAWIVKPEDSTETFALLERIGRVPLPPYIRKGEMRPDDVEHYQTVFAREPGSVAAPTAGLHFTDRLLRQLESQGVATARVTLHVGLGTFRPITADSLEEHVMHSEWAQVGEATVAAIEQCRARGGRVVAVGSTSVRTLETAAADGVLRPFSGQTNLFLRPPCPFNVVDAMLTNFHLPRTTLLVLVHAFAGSELMRRAYAEAIAEEYRFFSYGDAMLIL